MYVSRVRAEHCDWSRYREHWDSLTFAVSICPCQVNFTLSKYIVCHIQQLYISVILKLQNKWKPILVKIKWLMKHIEKVLFFKNTVDFLQKTPRSFHVLRLRLTNSRELFSSNFASVRTKYYYCSLCFKVYVLILAFIAAKESNNNRSLKGKKQSIRNSSSNVLQPFMAVTPLREESFRIIRKLFYGAATINIFLWTARLLVPKFS